MTAQKASDRPLEPAEPQMRAWVHEACERVLSHLRTLESQPAFVDEGGEQLAASLRRGFPDAPADASTTFDTIFDAALHSFNTAHPGYFAYVPGGGVFPAAVADFVADAINRYVGVWIAAPGLAQLEQNAVDWMLDLVGWRTSTRPRAGGVLSSGGSLANFSAVIAARAQCAPDDLRLATLYTSREVHHSVGKAAMLAGIPVANVRAIDVDNAFRIRPEALASAIEKDVAAGMRPMMIVASGGTTNTGAVDPLGACADLATKHNAWFHVDAAYGGFFLLTERGKQALVGIERANSITLDPHKGLFLPYGTGALLVRDRDALRRAHAMGAAYLPQMLGDSDDNVDFCELSPELSRGYRGLRVWLSLELLGVDAFRAALEEKLDLAAALGERLRAIPGLDLIAPPQLSLLGFRLHPPGLDDEVELTALNKQFLSLINASRNHYLTPTVSEGRFLLRACILHFRSHAEHTDRLADEVEAAAATVLARMQAPAASGLDRE